MKKLFSFLLLILIIFSLCCCSKQPSSVNEDVTNHDVEQEQTEFTLTEEKSIDYSNFENLLNDLCYENEYYTYHAYDINNDGIREMIVKSGSCDADYTYTFYKLDEEYQAVEIGVFSATSSTLYADKEKDGILCVYGKQGYQVITHISLTNYKIKTKTLVDEEISDGEYFSNNAPLSECYIKDKSLLAEDAELIGFELVFDPASIELPKGSNFDTIPISMNIIGMDFDLLKKKLTTTLFNFSPDSLQGIPISIKENQKLYYTNGNSPEWFIVEENKVVGYVMYPDGLVKQLFPSDDFYYTNPKIARSNRCYCCWKTANCYMIVDSISSDYSNINTCHDWRAFCCILIKDISQFTYSEQFEP